MSVTSAVPSPRPSERRAVAIGLAHEATLSETARRLGSHFTPPDVAAGLAKRALDHWSGRGVPRVCDPSCGAGALLVAMADELVLRGAGAADVLAGLAGVDLDPASVAATSRCLAEWGAEYGVVATPRVMVGDALDARTWSNVDRGPADIVIGNPPFQGQLSSETARTASARDRMSEEFGDAGTGYVDTSALFLLRSIEMVSSAGVVALILPRSFLVVSSARVTRRRVAASTDVVGIWLPDEQVFEADVDVCAVVLRVPSVDSNPPPLGRSAVALWTGRAAEVSFGSFPRADLIDETWASPMALSAGVPELDQGGGAPLGEVASATAGFRDQFYGLVGMVSDDEPAGRRARLATTALIDPATCLWGERTVRFARERWTTPWVDLDRLEASAPIVARWVDDRLGPKTMVATQTKVIEATADPDGRYVPLTPLISVVSRELDPWHVTAALLAPPATVFAHRRFGSAGRSRGSLRLAARQILSIPLPSFVDPWHRAADLLKAGSSDWNHIGRLGCRSWGLGDDCADEVLGWWMERVPSRMASARGDV